MATSTLDVANNGGLFLLCLLASVRELMANHNHYTQARLVDRTLTDGLLRHHRRTDLEQTMVHKKEQEMPAYPCIIFLDIDGVLNRNREANHIRIDEDLVARLRELVQATGAKIVMSTFWRKFLDYIAYIFARQGIGPGVVIGSTPGPAHQASKKFDGGQGLRSDEIRSWLAMHPEVNESFAIIDDRESAAQGPDLESHFVHTNSKRGLSAEDVQRAINICRSFTHGSVTLLSQRGEYKPALLAQSSFQMVLSVFTAGGSAFLLLCFRYGALSSGKVTRSAE